MNMQQDNWTILHDEYSKKEWVNKPSLFAESVINYLPPSGRLLELGAGLGQDSIYFANHGYDAVATDLETNKLQLLDYENITIMRVDLRQPLPFENGNFDIVYSHLALHYFDRQTTETIFREIYRVLKPGGIFAFFVNSISDPEYDTGVKIENDFFNINGVLKRYFSTDTANEFARKFNPILVDTNGETYKDSDKGVHNLIRYIGSKS
jgi:SAM-dependent methyltransferase